MEKDAGNLIGVSLILYRRKVYALALHEICHDFRRQDSHKPRRIEMDYR